MAVFRVAIDTIVLECQLHFVFTFPPRAAEPGPPIHDVHTLNELDEDQLSQMDWFQKGRWLVDKNKPILEYAEQQPRQNITLVSAMLNLGRHALGGGFARTFKHYIERFRGFMAYNYPKIIFIDADYYDDFKPLIDGSPGPVHVILRTVDYLKQNFKYYDLVQEIRKNPQWYKQQGWLTDSPQAKLEFYNPLVMSKIFWTTEASRLNPFNTDTFLFIDGGHLCNNPSGVNLAKQRFILDNFLNDKLFITYFDYVPAERNGEIHGFEKKAFQDYIGYHKLPLLVGRGGVFGGRPEFLEVAIQVLDVIMEETLSKRYMGTEENFFSILYYRFPELVHRYDNGEGGNCAFFNHVVDPPLDPKDYGYHLRGLLCEENWEELEKQGKPSCFHQDKTACPAYVTPYYLTKAENQYTCHDTAHFYCTVQCKRGTDQVAWSAHPCGTTDKPCFAQVGEGRIKPGDPGFRGVDQEYPDDRKDEENEQAGQHEEEEAETPPYDADKFSPNEEPNDIDSESLSEGEFYDLRGLNCAEKDGKTVCYEDDEYDWDECPSYVTPEFLTEAKTQHLCKVGTHYCTVSCQTGNENIHWHAHEKKWCDQNPGNCPPRPKKIPKSKFKLPQFERPNVMHRKCEEKGVRGPDGPVQDVSLGLLAHGSRELATLKQTLQSYEDNGLLDGVSEFMIYLNGRNRNLEDAVQPFADRHSAVKLMGTSKNIGILRAINMMALNSTNPVFLFLEKDFLLIEPWPCVYEQLTTGREMIQNGDAHVVRFRHRWRAGKPNFAKMMFRGDEERVFKQQPNLFCNHFHWIENPEERWPDKIWICHDSPYMYCSRSRYCNWTNNPTMMSVKWWYNEYVRHFKEFKQNDPYYDIEVYMNWEPNAWNDREWIVAQGEGLFRHTDRNRF